MKETAKITMQYRPPKSYLDMARAVIGADLSDPKDLSKNDAIFGLMSCTYIYSYMAITAFVSGQLYRRWNPENSRLRRKYPKYSDFQELMKCEFREIKHALKALCDELGIRRHDKGSPQAWGYLNQFLKEYRDWFVHPTPEQFDANFKEVAERQWGFASHTAAEVIGYYYDELGESRPEWLRKGALVIPRLKVV